MSIVHISVIGGEVELPNQAVLVEGVGESFVALPDGRVVEMIDISPF